MNYQDLEKAVFDFLYSKHQRDSTFRFSVRKRANEETEKDYFIGKEGQGYFSFTLWDIPLDTGTVPVDPIDFVVLFGEGTAYLSLEYTIDVEKSPKKSTINLDLGNLLRQRLQLPGFKINHRERNGYVSFIRIKEIGDGYDSIESFLPALGDFMNKIATTVDASIAESNPNRTDFRIKGHSFQKMLEGLEKRLGLHLKTPESKIARICWNTRNWREPAGPDGKSKSKDSHEFENGYGHEEWIFDFDRQIEGYHYGFLQALNTKNRIHAGKTYDITLYTIDGFNNEKYWVGKIENVEVLTDEQARKAFKHYQKQGWLAVMESQLKRVGANVRNFSQWENLGLLNCRFRHTDYNPVQDSPRPFAKNEKLRNFHYVLLPDNGEALTLFADKADLTFPKNQSAGKKYFKRTFQSQVREYESIHNQIQDGFLKWLRETHPDDDCHKEATTAYATRVDVVRVMRDGGRVFYEVKSYRDAKTCVRVAIGQLMEYAYFPNKSLAEKLVVVGDCAPGSKLKSYLRHLNKSFQFPISYIQFDYSKNAVIEEV